VRFLADESCDFAVVRALRTAGHDIHAVAELLSGLDDAAVMSLALRERRVLLTEDKDFGQLVYANAEPSVESFSSAIPPTLERPCRMPW
jgi:predicted nuclease of predicted toxin-antitoxin system